MAAVLVMPLFQSGRPVAVPWGVRPSVVPAFYRQAVRLFAHISQEVIETQPSRIDGNWDVPAAVACPVLVSGVGAALDHGSPYVVGRAGSPAFQPGSGMPVCGALVGHSLTSLVRDDAGTRARFLRKIARLKIRSLAASVEPKVPSARTPWLACSHVPYLTPRMAGG